MRVAPDVLRIVLDYLRAHTDVAAITSGRVSASLPAAPVFPAITAAQADGNYRDAHARWTYEATIDFETWALDRPTANRLARTALAALLESINYQHVEGVVVDVVELAGPRWLPDMVADPPVPKYMFSLIISAHN